MGNTTTYRVLIAAGGTGGHVYPAIAIADAIRRQVSPCEITFAGTRDHMEWDVVPRAGYSILPIWISGFHRKFTFKNLMFPVKLLTAMWQSMRIIRRVNPHVVICCGGYVSGPIGRVAGWKRKPLMLQEQNSYPGVTNRLLGQKATRIFTAFEDAASHFPVKKVRLLGNPVRSDITRGNAASAASANDFRTDKKTILVMGGSGGAKAINEAMIKHIDYLHNELHLQIIWQCGKRYLGDIMTRIDEYRYPNLRIVSFIDSMPDTYALADLVVCRSGAGTIAELMVLGKPSILVPSPHVAGDHQRHNAESIAKNGAAEVLTDNELDEKLSKSIAHIIADERTLSAMSQKALQMAHPSADELIATEIITLTHPDHSSHV
jgi:UDP-N-acetylglucosamine--N-acetylmuramyl-(pentapeptide) pyrophosphoryl-undecaprenol N-acetylglucosamine transferase